MGKGCGSITIESGFAPGNVSVIGCGRLPDSGKPGDSFEMDVRVDNRNSSTATTTVQLLSGSQVLGETTTSIRAESDKYVTVRYAIPAGAAGEISLTAETTTTHEGSTEGSILGRVASVFSGSGREDARGSRSRRDRQSSSREVI